MACNKQTRNIIINIQYTEKNYNILKDILFRDNIDKT